VIAAKAVAFGEALKPEFAGYQKQIIANAGALADALMEHGWKLVSGGTDNHLILMDLRGAGITGKVAEEALDSVGITVNKNTVPFDPEKPFITSGVRIGTPAVTTRGMKEPQMRVIASLIDRTLRNIGSPDALAQVSRQVDELVADFPLYSELIAAIR